MRGYREMSSEGAAAPGGETASGTAGTVPFDTSVAHQARMYDYVLGGKDNYAADRAAMDAALEVWPDMAYGARANRAFLGRMVRYLVREAGIRQFLDIGTGIPTAGNAHEVAQAIAPECRVVYVDYDPVVLAHARALLSSSEQGATEYIDADLRDTGKILAQAARLIDFSRPVAVTLLSVLHAVPDSDDPWGIVATLLEAIPSGSYLAVSCSAGDLMDADALARLKDAWKGSVQQQLAFRDREQAARFFAGTGLVEPGLVPVDEWRPEPGTAREGNPAMWAGVGRKP